MSYICSACVGDSFLKKLVAASASKNDPCEYCDLDMPTVEIWIIAEQCDRMLEMFYEVSSQTAAVVHFDRRPAGQDLSTIVENVAQVPTDAVADIVSVLVDMWYDKDSGESKYGSSDDDEPWFVPKESMAFPISAAWSKMEESLRYEARYQNPHVTRLMESIFGGIAHDAAANGASVLVDAGPSTNYPTLFRARVFQSEKGLIAALRHPERLLGAPEAGRGTAGRMNSAGQPAYYGATNAETAIAEVRPPVGSWVAVASFAVIRELKLLDLTLLREVKLKNGTSLFDPLTVSAAQRRDFLRVFCDRITLPVMPESQDHDYLITQVVADYLSTHPHASVDGIVYPSAQRRHTAVGEEGRNVALFYKASACLNADNGGPTADAQLWDYDPDGRERFWQPTIMFSAEAPRHQYLRSGSHPSPSLQLLQDSIQIHRVESIDIATKVTPLKVGVIGL